MLLLSNADVRQVLTMESTIAILEEAYRQLFRGEAVCRPRINVQVDTGIPGTRYNWSTTEGASSVSGYFAIRMMSDVLTDTEYHGVRTREKHCVRPGLFFGLVLLTDVHTGEPLALMHDGYLQHVRQGADGGIGARYMAREDAEVVGMLGSGGMARSHAEAFCCVRKIKKMVVFSPTPEHRDAYVREMAERLGITVVAVDRPDAVYAGADILCGCTDSTRPVVMGKGLEPGMHVVEVGGRLDEDATRRVDVALRFGVTPAPVGLPEWRVPGDSLVYAAGRAGAGEASPREARMHGDAGARVADERIISLADLWDGRAQGRRSRADITYSERGGLRGVQFVSVAAHVYELCRQRGLGRELPTEWFLQDIRN
jgi:ornithine cyclodeaminase/alanine dehydrogenase-like protein (mu-crystallin family)